MSRLLLMVATVLGLASIPALAEACAVCVPANERTQAVYLGMTVMMSLLPLALMGGVIYLVVRAHREGETATAETRESAQKLG
ncbi:MAG: hypothetical protein HY791_07030 [Deltaproteobacteria bacterium]|nr:hypothetical protein [Deltaproteobacteria bacterium]